MIKLTKVTTADTQNNYQVSYERTTVAEVLEEIREYTNNSAMFGKLDDYGYPSTDIMGHCWEICVDDHPYKTGWIGHKTSQNFDMLSEVTSVECSGGWYCALDFNLITNSSKEIEI